MRRGVSSLLAATMIATGVGAQDYPPAFPRVNASALFETDRFVVWDVVWPKGQPTPLHRHLYDQVGTYYQAGGRVISELDGTRRAASTQVGALSNTRGGTTHIEEGITDPPLRAVFIELRRKGMAAVSLPAEPFSPMFPRSGAVERLNDDRVTVWDYTWQTGEATEGAHQYEAVWVWLGEGTLDIRGATGNATRMRVAAGQIRHVPPRASETIRAVSGSPRAMIFAIK